MKQVAFFSGSFDPITNGHLEIIKRAATLFDEVIVGIFDNPQKNYLFTMTERKELVQQVCQDFINVRVKAYQNMLVAKAVQAEKASFIIKGLRNGLDYEYEKVPAQVHFQEQGIETVFINASVQNSIVSSSLVKELAQFKGEYQQYVPNVVAKAIAQKV